MDKQEFIEKYNPKNHPTMCPLLFKHFSTETRGDIKFCCEAVPDFKDFKHVNGNELKIVDIFNGEFYNTRRRQMMNGIKIPECQQCWRKESQGLISKRLQEWEWLIEGQPDDFFNNFSKWESGEKIYPTYYNLQVSKTCNYACIMCSHSWSSLITHLGKRLGKEQSIKLYGQRWYDNLDLDYKLDESETFWEGLKEASHQLTDLYVTGGEPFLIKSLWRYMEFLVEKGYSKNIKFWCNTNASHLKKNQLEILKQFRNVELNLSIDAYGELNEYLRTASEWDNIQENVALLQQYLNPNFQVSIVPVVHALNVRELEPLVEWWKDIVQGHRCVVRPIALVWPLTMHMNVLPSKYVDEALDSIIKIAADPVLDKGQSDFTNVINQLKSHQFDKPMNDKLKEEFEYFNEAIKKDYFQRFAYVFE